ncbi:hypothetical protein [Lentibacillus cibarius]|uniref:hypothetical protein n=1 Tax=Lentibacillus cibarius TaxID=2583219 RepID=UPI00163DE2B4|nr:hypothetical protein [Lentibacillus cibarius]
MWEFKYVLYAFLLGIIALFTGEIVTFIMLGFILVTLTNINNTLKTMRDGKPGE